MKPSGVHLLAAFEPVRRVAEGLPEVQEGTSYGTPALRVRGKGFARLREDGESLVLRTDFDSRDVLLRAQPDVFYITDHYRDYPYVLVRLSAIHPDQLRELVADSWFLMAPKTLVARREAGGTGSR
ncbi:MAG: MmcQ/YjbR family DNA-binding protein [Gemmatimonadota bacterium]